MLRAMKWVSRALLLGTACSLVLAAATDAKKPPLKRACQLATNAEVNATMGRKLNRTSNEPTGCGWQGGPKAQAGLTIYGFKTVAIAKQYLAGKVKGYEFCIDAPDHFLPHSGLGVVPSQVVQPRGRRAVAERAVWSPEVVVDEPGRELCGALR
jgi:hypothetical protein